MPDKYLNVLVVLYAVALIPIAVSYFLPLRYRIAALASIIGVAAIGAGVAFAGVWIGVLMMNGGRVGMSVVEVARAEWQDLVLIVAASPAVGVIFVNYRFIKHSRAVETPKTPDGHSAPETREVSRFVDKVVVNCASCGKPNRVPAYRNVIFKCGHSEHRNIHNV